MSKGRSIYEEVLLDIADNAGAKSLLEDTNLADIVESFRSASFNELKKCIEISKEKGLNKLHDYLRQMLDEKRDLL